MTYDPRTDSNADSVNTLDITGVIQMYCGSTAPAGWLMCDGSTISDTGDGGDYTGSEYEALFNRLKSNGFGNAGTESWGTDTVKIPNMSGVGVTGAGTQNINARAKGGDSLGDTVEDEAQIHSHYMSYNAVDGANNASTINTYRDTTGVGTSGIVIGNVDLQSLISVGDQRTSANDTAVRKGTENKMSSVVVNFIIKI